MRIFIADDSALLRRQLIELLCDLNGIEVVGQAAGAGEALTAIRTLRPDVVMLDIQMSDGISIDLLKRIKKENLVQVVIMLTNLISLPYREKYGQAGADYFFDKANEINEVRRVVQDLLPQFNRADD